MKKSKRFLYLPVYVTMQKRDYRYSALHYFAIHVVQICNVVIAILCGNKPLAEIMKHNTFGGTHRIYVIKQRLHAHSMAVNDNNDF